MFIVKNIQDKARCGEFATDRGIISTPVFMNVATQAAIKGAVSSEDLRNVRCSVALCNTYHLHIRPGDELISSMGGLHKFMHWDRPILTDSGGFQVFSLSKLRKITEEGVSFNSHVDGRKIFMSPEDSIRIQHNLGADIIMAFDECIELPASHDYVKDSCDRTYRWLQRCKDELERLSKEDYESETPELKHFSGGLRGRPAMTMHQSLFGINQGGTYNDLRREHMLRICELDLPGYAIGGLAVGETTTEMYDTVSGVEEYMPIDKPRYLMGVGTPQNLVECVARGIDFFDCVMPARNGRHGKLYTWGDSGGVLWDEKSGIFTGNCDVVPGSININNEVYKNDERPIDESCDCPVCKHYSRAYIRHLFKSGEMLGMRFGVLHNLYYYNTLMSRIRSAITNGTFDKLRKVF